MSERDENQVREALKSALEPIGEADLQRDLWPQMLQRLDSQEAVRVAWFDWILAALLGAACLFYPGMVPALLYHL
jgi:hypothetical protein